MILEIALVFVAHPAKAAWTRQSYPAGHSLAHISALVPDEQTASDIGMAIFRPLLGDHAVRSSLPFRATLSAGVWRVVGTPPKSPNTAWDPVYIYIAKTNGWVVEISRSPNLSKHASVTFLNAMNSLRRKHER